MPAVSRQGISGRDTRNASERCLVASPIISRSRRERERRKLVLLEVITLLACCYSDSFTGGVEQVLKAHRVGPVKSAHVRPVRRGWYVNLTASGPGCYIMIYKLETKPLAVPVRPSGARTDLESAVT